MEAVYFQPDQNIKLQFPCIVYARKNTRTFHSGNHKYLKKKLYDVTVIDRNPDSEIPDRVEDLPYTSFDRFYINDGLNHFIFQLYF